MVGLQAKVMPGGNKKDADFYEKSHLSIEHDHFSHLSFVNYIANM